MRKITRRSVLLLGLGAAGLAVTGEGPRPSLAWPPASPASLWRRPLVSAAGPRFKAVDLSGLKLPGLSPWFGARVPVAYDGGGDCALYVARSTDQLVPVQFHADCWRQLDSGCWRQQNNSAAIEDEIRAGADWDFGGRQFNPYSAIAAAPGLRQRVDPFWSNWARMPFEAVAAQNADGHMAVLQPNGWVLETFATIRMSDGGVVCGFASYTDPAGSGDGLGNGRRASLIPNYAGLIRAGEMASGVIDHALAVALGAEGLAATHQYPACATDRECADCRGPVPMGGLLAIPPSVDLRHAGFATRDGMALAKAAQWFGCYVVDRAGPEALVFCAESFADDVPRWQRALSGDLARLRDLLMLVISK